MIIYYKCFRNYNILDTDVAGGKIVCARQDKVVCGRQDQSSGGW